MTLAAGTKLGPYEITGALGAGGMGEVYRARDTKLNRDVALKVLPEAFASDPQRMARFEREAQVLASLNHPNIAAIYGLEESGSTRALVMELVEGQTLAERLASRPLTRPASRDTLSPQAGRGQKGSDSQPSPSGRGWPAGPGEGFDDALQIAKQVAEALEYAHDRGVVHRDLKPANIKITPEGTVKVLDFGLAKAMGPDEISRDASNSPTLSIAATQAGFILGTAAYMSPEQAKAKPVDRRADIWAFGVVLFEMFSGKKTFEGETVSDVLAAVIMKDPDWSALPETTPPSIQRLIRRCLNKDPKQRLQAIGEARITIEETLSGTGVPPVTDHGPEAHATTAARPASQRRWLLPTAVVVAILATFVITRFFLHRNAGESQTFAARVTVSLPADAQLAAGNFTPSIVFSPDGGSLAYVAEGTDGVRRLAVRQLDSDQVTIIPGTEGAEGPFFSPDGQWIGYWSHWKIWKVRASGAGIPEAICNSMDFRGATWAGHTIIFTPSQTGPLFKVSDNGGEPEPFTKLLPGEFDHRFPHALPDGDTILFSAWSMPFDPDRAKMAAVSLSTGKRTDIGPGGMDVLYSPPGYLLYVQAGKLLSAPFDLNRLKITGEARVILDHVVTQMNTGAAQFAVSPQGNLAWIQGGSVGNDVRLVRVSRKGVATTIFKTNTARRFPRLSPDDRKLLVLAVTGEAAGTWLMSIDGKEQRHLSEAELATWFPDGRRWVGSSRNLALIVDSVDGTYPPRQLIPSSPRMLAPTSVSATGTIAYDFFGPKGIRDVWLVDSKGGAPKPFLVGPADEGGMQFSPDGRYVAYVSNRSGQFEVYVTSFPDKSATWQISTSGGSEVVWQRDGKEITYRSGPSLIAVPVTTQPTFHAGNPSVLFHVPYDGLLGGPDEPDYDVARDGSWFVMVNNPDFNVPAPTVQMALDWQKVEAAK